MQISFAGEQYLEKETEVFYNLTADKNCSVWCNNNRLCAGYYVLDSTCHFVNSDNLQTAGCNSLYEKKGIISKNITTNLKLILFN